MWCTTKICFGFHFVSDKIKCVLFADCTNILYSSKEIEDVENTVNLELSKFHKWNIHPINISKNNYMIFNKLRARFIPSIYNDDHNIEWINIYFLVFLDSHLNWEELISYVTTTPRTLSFLLFKASEVSVVKVWEFLTFPYFISHWLLLWSLGRYIYK